MKIKIAANAMCIAILTALAIGSSSAAAQPKPIDSIDQGEMIERVNENSLAPAMAVVTGNQLLGVDGEGNPKLIGTATNGLRFEVNFRGCGEATDDAARHCQGYYMMSVWDALPEEKIIAFREAMAEFLPSNPMVNTGQTADGSPYVVRYVIADHGTKQGNVVSEIANFIRSATGFQNAIAPLYSQ